MFFHVMVGANDIEAAKRFYDASFAALGVAAKGQIRETPKTYMYGDAATGLYFITEPQDGHAATPANGGTIMFKAASAADVSAWHAAAMAHGGVSLDAPGPGPFPGSTVARLRDPTGNKIAAIAMA